MQDKSLLDIIKIGIFYDGYYFYRVSNYYKYEHEKKARISISGLHEFVRKEVAALAKMDIRQCKIVDAHYFKGRSSARDLGEKVQSERVFEDILMRENIVSHYLPLRYNENNGVQEKGIDVWLALEAYELAVYKHFDILVLVAGDGDYVPLVRKLHTVGTRVMLVSWDFSYYNENGDQMETKTSRQLSEEVFYPIKMCQKIDGKEAEENKPDKNYIDGLFVTERQFDKFPQENAARFSTTPYAEDRSGNDEEDDNIGNVDAEGELTSVIISLSPNGFGFIKDEARNNVFFHYSNLTNCEFSDLRIGTRVRCTVEEDTDHGNRFNQNTTRYRAITVAVIE